jgi:DNA invertase Pin-like site-specific DNA recombinase
MNGRQKITPEHLTRRAIVYLRQSSEAQVKQNTESQRLQYALTEKARDLGFQQVEVIDCDLGASAGVAAQRREGFERMLGAVALSQVGLIISRELSRLLRTDKDYCQLVELCQAFGVLVADEDSVYDPVRMDDQLVLGIKATMSVVELKVLRMRLRAGAENKAKRGELYPRLPPGYVWDPTQVVVKDPNLRVQEAIALVFSKFRETWSIRQTFVWLRENNVELPVTRYHAGGWTAVFQPARIAFVSSVLHNPFYAGAYCWGRRPTEVAWEGGVLRKRTAAVLSPQQARVFIPQHHDGYIDWNTFEENQQMIRRNHWVGNSDGAGAPRSGRALLSGLLRCGRCGRNLHVRYWGKAGTPGRYQCAGDYDEATKSRCVGFGGERVDRRFSDEVVAALSPLSIEASFAAIERAEAKEEEGRRVLQRRIEQLTYEAQRAFEQYDQADARNRLVSSELEARWNTKLEQLEEARAALAATLEAACPLSAAERQELIEFGSRFADAWHHPECPIELKKQIVRTVVEVVIVNETSPGQLSFIVHWKGGSHTRFEMDKPNAKTTQRTAEEDLEIIRQMSPRYGESDIARVLNKLGRKTGKGHRWTSVAVRTARRLHRIAGPRDTVCDPEILSMQAAARYTETSDTTIKKLVDVGCLSMVQIAPFAPWEIRRSELDSEPVRTILEGLRRTGRLEIPDTSIRQPDLFQ